MRIWRKMIYTMLVFLMVFLSIEGSLRYIQGPLAPSILVYSSVEILPNGSMFEKDLPDRYIK